MLICGIDAHKRTHTVVVVDERGRQVAVRTTRETTTAAHLELLRWAEAQGEDRLWAVEDCRHVSRRLEADLLAAGERIVRVPPKLMANQRDSVRAAGKSDPIDALAVARAALREPDLPAAQLDGPARQLRLLVDHREDLVAERTRHINRLRWHLHELDAGWDPALGSARKLDAVIARLEEFDHLVATIASDLCGRIRQLTIDIDHLEGRIKELVRPLAPTLLAITGVAELTAAKILAEVADIRRFRSKDAFARHNGTAPQPAWSGNSDRHRLARAGNRQLNAVLHRIAITQGRCHPAAAAYLERRITAGATKREARRSLKRRLSDVIYRAALQDATNQHTHPQPIAA